MRSDSHATIEIHAKNVLTQLGVTSDVYLAQRRFPVNALREDAPRDFLRNVVSETLSPAGCRRSFPRLIHAAQIPTTTALTRNIDLDVGSRLCRGGAVGERQSTQEAIQTG